MQQKYIPPIISSDLWIQHEMLKEKQKKELEALQKKAKEEKVKEKEEKAKEKEEKIKKKGKNKIFKKNTSSKNKTANITPAAAPTKSPSPAAPTRSPSPDSPMPGPLAKIRRSLWRKVSML